MDPTVIGALICAGVAIVVAILPGAVVLGIILAKQRTHGRLLTNGLASDTKANTVAIGELAKRQAVVIEHQRGQDDRLNAVLAGLSDLNRQLAAFRCIAPSSRCGPARLIQGE